MGIVFVEFLLFCLFLLSLTALATKGPVELSAAVKDAQIQRKIRLICNNEFWQDAIFCECKKGYEECRRPSKSEGLGSRLKQIKQKIQRHKWQFNPEGIITARGDNGFVIFVTVKPNGKRMARRLARK